MILEEYKYIAYEKTIKKTFEKYQNLSEEKKVRIRLQPIEKIECRKII